MQIKSFFIVAICSIVQYYDYHLFGFLAAKISKTFFLSTDNSTQLLKTYFIMAIAVLAKPFGALILGRIGDIYGRFATIIISLSGTAIASFVICITPSYKELGLFAALILLLTRMVIAALASSGTDGVRIYIFEHVSKNRQSLGNGVVTFFTQIGSLLASLSAWFFSLEYMPDYAWRYAFLVGTILGIIAIIIRIKYIKDGDDYTQKTAGYEIYKDTTTLNIVRQHWKIFILCAIIAGCIGSTNQFMIIFFGTYNFEILKLLPASEMQFNTSIGIIIYMSAAIVGGYVADKFGKRFIINITGIIVAIFTLILSSLIAYNNFSLKIYLSIILFLPFITMPALAFVKQSIPTVVRYRLFSLAHAIGSITISAPTAYISTKAYQMTGQSWIPMIYFITTVILMIIIVNILHYIQLLEMKNKASIL